MKEFNVSDMFKRLSEVLDEAEKHIVMIRASRPRTKDTPKRPNLYLVTQKEMDRLRGSE